MMPVGDPDQGKSVGNATGATIDVESSRTGVIIDERLAIVDDRQCLSYWEVDMIIGKGYHHAIVFLTE
jgi:IS30 family transposase